MSKTLQYLQYLHEAKIEQIASELERQGYRVWREEGGFDLLGEKGNHRVAYEVKVRGDRKPDPELIRRLHDRARQQGYEFRLAIVSPPHETNAHVAGLDERLFEALANRPPPELERLELHVEIARVHGIEIDSLEIDSTGTAITGSGVLDLRSGNGKQGDRHDVEDSVPFSFSVKLNPDLSLASIDSLTIDASFLNS